MPSIRDFLTLVETRDSGHRITLRTPLTADPNKPHVGWVTRLTFLTDILADVQVRTAKVERVTTFVNHTPGGLRRRLKDQPQTTEKLTIHATSGTYTTFTRWDWMRTSAASTTPGLSFAIADLVPLLRGVVETNEGRPLLDWVAENAAEVASYLTDAGWLPQTLEEFSAMKRERDADDECLIFGDEEEDEEEEEDDEENDPEDRWR